jgi:hypothetical protein
MMWFNIKEAILIGEIIEEYPDDKYSPSCLINRLEIVLTDRSPSPCPLPQDWGRGLG